ncbi:MFS general substrate transporter, partial [Lojkania enalia]
FYVAFVSICTCTFIATVDTVILATALPAITRSLRATSNEAYWCGTGFLLAQTVSQPLYGAFQEIVGHKRTMLGALSLFLFMSIFCATAQSITWLVATRVQGLGGGGINAMVNVLVSDMVPLHERGTFAGLNNLAGAVGLVSGVVLGATFAEKSTWRLIFYINLPICTIAGTGLMLCLRIPRPTKPIRSEILKIDYLGAIILTPSLVALLYGITGGGGVLFAWSHPRIICALVIGAIGVVITIVCELKFAKYPMIPPIIFQDLTAVSGYFSAWIHGIVLWALAYYLILYFLIARGHSLLHAALEILPGIASIPFCAALFGIVMAITKHYKWLNVFAWVSLSVGIGLLALLTPQTNLGKAYGYQIVLAIGGGIIFPGRILAVQVSQQRENVPIATTMVSFFTSLGEAFGVGIGGSIFQNRWAARTESYLRSGVLPQEYVISSHAAEGSAAYIKTLPTVIQDIYRDIAAGSLRALWTTFAAFGVAAFFVSLVARNRSLVEDCE